MLNKLKDFFIEQLNPQNSEEDAEKKLQLATAVLLIEIAKADYEIHHYELTEITQLLGSTFSLTKESIEQLIKDAQSASNKSISLHEYVHIMNTEYSTAQKKQIIALLWQVAYADQHLDKYEDYVIRKVSDLLHVPHQDFIQTKLEHKKTKGL